MAVRLLKSSDRYKNLETVNKTKIKAVVKMFQRCGIDLPERYINPHSTYYYRGL